MNTMKINDLRKQIKLVMPEIKRLDKLKKKDLLNIIIENKKLFEKVEPVVEKVVEPVVEKVVEPIVEPIMHIKKSEYKEITFNYSRGTISACERKALIIFNKPQCLRKLHLNKCNKLVNFFYNKLISQ